MAKFCGNCGAQMEDDALICGNCGTPLRAAGGEGSDKTGKMQHIKLVLMGVAAVLALVVVLSIVTSFTGYRGLTRRVMAAYKNEEPEKLAELSSDLSYDIYESHNGGLEDHYRNSINSKIAYFDNLLGFDYKLSHKVEETEKLTGRRLQNTLDGLSWSVTDKAALNSIKKIMNVTVTLTAKSGSRRQSRTVTLQLVKEGLSWKLLDIT